MTDFADYAQPLLAQLRSDPKKSHEVDQYEPTTFPSSGTEDLLSDITLMSTEVDSNSPSSLHDDVRDEDRNAARRAYGMVGMDVLAFYKSFRFKQQQPCSGIWGIFLLKAGVAGLTDELAALAPSVSRAEIRQLAVEILMAHERYHFWVDVWALGQELIPLIDAPVRRYVYYLYGKQQVALTEYDFEESLANHYAFQKLRRWKFSDGTTANRVLQRVLSDGPPPYCDFRFDALERVRREGVLAHAIGNGLRPDAAMFEAALKYGLQYGAGDVSVTGAGIRPVSQWHPVAGPLQCPIHLVNAPKYAQLVQPFQGPKLSELKDFLTAYLAGKREQTDHIYYRIDNGEKVKFPNPHDKEVRGYEFKNILYKAGMTLRDFNHEQQKTKNWSRHCPRDAIKPPLGVDNG